MENHWNKKVELLYRNCGTNWAVFIRGAADDVEQEFYGMYNHGATDGEIQWQTPENAYFWTTREKLEKCLTNRALFWLLNQDGHEESDEEELLPVAKQMAETLMGEMVQQSNLMTFGNTYDTYELGEVSAESSEEHINNGPSTVQVNISRLMGSL
jgi:hypothetical protein